MADKEMKLVAATNVTALPRRSIEELDLNQMPERLDDELFEMVREIAQAPLPALPSCDERTFGQALRMMLATLPRRQADDVSGELFVAAYERQLGHLSKPQVNYLLDKALQNCRWFPTIAECLELVEGWRRNDEHTARRRLAQSLVLKEDDARRDDTYEWCEKSMMNMTQSFVDEMPPTLQRIGLKCGALYTDDDGKIRPRR